MSTDILDRPPAGWHATVVAKEHSYKWDWVVLMIDVHPDELKRRLCKTLREVWVRIPGKHRNHDAAWEAAQDMLTTRH